MTPDEPNYKALYTEEREKYLRLDPDFPARNGEACDYPACGCEADTICHVALPLADVRADLLAAEQALSDLKREVLEKVGPFAALAKYADPLLEGRGNHYVSGTHPTQWITGKDLRALSSLHERVGQPPSSDPVTTSDQGE